ncbi:hypothetical protein J2X45_003177 [Caulobacter sp. BE264]|nr:hypothetical protein [Caulobacter sp. BE264]
MALQSRAADAMSATLLPVNGVPATVAGLARQRA